MVPCYRVGSRGSDSGRLAAVVVAMFVFIVMGFALLVLLFCAGFNNSAVVRIVELVESNGSQVARSINSRTCSRRSSRAQYYWQQPLVLGRAGIGIRRESKQESA